MQIEKQAIADRFARLPRDKQKIFLDALRKQGVDFARLPIVPAAGAQDAAALSYAQLRQWFLWELDPRSTAYHINGALKLRGALDVAALKASFAALVERHASLHTVFRPDGQGLSEQRILERIDFDVEMIDLAGLAPQAAEDGARDAAQRLTDTPFDLTRGPLLRVGLLRLAADVHVLVVVMHHIVSDGWSKQILVDEFMQQYRARVRGETPAMAPLPVRYADYAAWQRNWLEAGEKERQLAYWTERLGTANPVLQLPTDHSRRPDGRYQAAGHTVELSRELVQQLHQLAHGNGATLFMVLLAGFQVLLHRHSGERDIRVGVPVANRTRAEIEGVIGFFVNTQVQRNVMDSRTPLSKVLAQTKEAALGAQAHQDLPFEQLVEALRPDRSLSVSPLFQVVFNHERIDGRAFAQLPGIDVEGYALGDPAAQFELVLNTSEDADGRVNALFAYAAELFDAESIERMAGHYVAILSALASRGEQAVGDVDLLGASEKAQLAQWSVNTRREPGLQPVHRLIEGHARSQPQATALLFADEALSFFELNRRANRLAHRLISLGVGPDVLVGIAMQRSVEMVVGILAILKAGGAYLPLDPEYPTQRLAYMVEDSGIELLLTHRATRDHIAAREGLVTLEVEHLDLANEPESDPNVALHGEHLAYVIYTSGSTGRPKGAAIRHDALHSCMAWMQRVYGLGREDTVLHKAPFGFDVSCWELFWPMTAGARLVVANPGDHRDPERLVQLIQRHQITTLNFVPAMLQAFLAHPGIEASTRLKHIICGGEAMPSETQKEALQRLSGATLQNLYGPTETTIHVTRWTCRDDGQALVPIGQPISDTQGYVLDAELNLVPRGVAGELYLGGVSLARGYLNKPGLSAERFVADPFGSGGRLYRTGDLVRWNAEGQIEYLGRIDHQVKIRGFRIELGEIEAQLLSQPEVREAVVVARQAPGGGRASLVGYVAAHAGQVADSVVLRERLGRVLPDYMVPRVVVTLPSLPLNANGKVDRSALPDPEVLGRERAFDAPQGDAEEALAGIWREVLGVERVARNDNFFELGGDSILSLKLIAKVRQQLPGGSRLGLADVMQAGSLAALADRLQQRLGDSHHAVCLHAGGAGVPLFCMPGLIVNTREFQVLARALEGDRPVYGFVSHVYTAKRWRGFAIRELAAEYADFILATATGGRCALLGWSLGGDLAFEVARQLEGRIEVAFIGAVDVFETEPMIPAGTLTSAQRAQADQALAEWLARSEMAAQWTALMARMDARERDWVAEQMLDPAEAFPSDGAGDEAAEYLLWATLDSRVQSMRHAYESSARPVHVFQAESSLRRDGRLRDWSAHAPVAATDVLENADHLDIIRHPQLSALVKRRLLAVDAA
ncbi:non-ribosomal peptide synthetase [Variovorax sp. 770b2]|uniref:non-ribosomal peptide synthetase n=1 Tax=Variovorax sp. 770b2 TaxID=1566271 RepID=UPI0008E8D0BF|nr:non-ribosomal peptide synthetase [Variovorax sp. 770b2]SFP15972.1 amino acid adenylation domain-containing protein [Variovorax sp. 770b2]